VPQVWIRLGCEMIHIGSLSVARSAKGERWTLLQGDSQRILRELPAETFDAMIVDPPYSSGGFVRGDRMKQTAEKYARGEGPKELALSDFEGDNRDQRGFLAWAQLWLWDARVATKKGGAVFVFSDWRQLPVTSDAVQAGGWVWRGIFVWDKLSARPMGYGRFTSRSEYGLWGSNGPMALVTDQKEAEAQGLETSFLQGAFGCTSVSGASKAHVTQKPAELMRYVCGVCPRDGLVLDPFAGVGSTGVGALLAGRRFFGIELDAKAFDRAVRRLEKAEKEGRHDAADEVDP
jgi:site-specific DNA-methyltransferase (adenine-specific)